jgi:hypothetical protein
MILQFAQFHSIAFVRFRQDDGQILHRLPKSRKKCNAFGDKQAKKRWYLRLLQCYTKHIEGTGQWNPGQRE